MRCTPPTTGALRSRVTESERVGFPKHFLSAVPMVRLLWHRTLSGPAPRDVAGVREEFEHPLVRGLTEH